MTDSLHFRSAIHTNVTRFVFTVSHIFNSNYLVNTYYPNTISDENVIERTKQLYILDLTSTAHSHFFPSCIHHLRIKTVFIIVIHSVC